MDEKKKTEHTQTAVLLHQRECDSVKNKMTVCPRLSDS